MTLMTNIFHLDAHSGCSPPLDVLGCINACSGNILALQFFAVQAEVPTFVHGGPIDQAFL